MDDPVIDNDGISYEKEAILQWLNSGKNISPVTKKSLKIEDLRPNRALKETIDKYKASGTMPVAEIIPDVEDWVYSEEDAKIDLLYSGFEKKGIVTISPKKGKRMPSHVCAVIDVSYSMNSEATVKSETGKNESYGLTVLDVVKHALRTISKSLSKNDLLSIVTFSDSAKIVLEPIVMDSSGQSTVESVINGLRVEGQTNLWAGMKSALDLIKKYQDINRNDSIKVLTDGCPNVSPGRGEVHALKQYYENNGGIFGSIDTFGFGYNLDSQLLKDIATEGNGSYSFIPDSGMVGTIFVNSMANQLSTVGRNVKLNIEWNSSDIRLVEKSYLLNYQTTIIDDNEIMIMLPSVRYGTDIVIPFEFFGDGEVDMILSYDTPGKIGNNVENRAYIKSNDIHSANNHDGLGVSETITSINKHEMRLTFVETIVHIINLVDYKTRKGQYGTHSSVSEENLKYAQDYLAMQTSRIKEKANTQFIIDLLEGLSGQIKEACSNVDYYKRWGCHYLPSLAMANLQQICNNFKDKSVQHYAGELFDKLRDQFDTLYNSIPPPKPSISVGRSYYGNVGTGSSSPIPLSSMARYNRVGNPCFTSNCTVEMLDGTKKNINKLLKGDIIKCDNGYDEVECLIGTTTSHKTIQIVKFSNDLEITPWHPIKINGVWRFPQDIGTPIGVNIPMVYNLVMKNRKSVIINDTVCCTLGHNIKGSIIEHDYYGTERVINDMSKISGWDIGTITIHTCLEEKDIDSNHTIGLVSEITVQ
jgi:Mg-chelatase subunit ChlD